MITFFLFCIALLLCNVYIFTCLFVKTRFTEYHVECEIVDGKPVFRERL